MNSIQHAVASDRRYFRDGSLHGGREFRIVAEVVPFIPERVRLRAAMEAASERFQHLLNDIAAYDDDLAAAEREVKLTRSDYEKYLSSEAGKPWS